MNGFRSHSRDARVWRYQRAGGRAVSLEIREFWMEAAEAWRVAAQAAPRTEWQQFARQRAERCHQRCRGRRVMKKQ